MKKSYEILGEKCIPMLRRYQNNGNVAIELVEVETNERLTVATTNLNCVLPEGQAYIKNYGGQEGIVEDLQAAGIIKEILGYTETGFVEVPLVVINLNMLETDEYSKWPQ